MYNSITFAGQLQGSHQVAVDKVDQVVLVLAEVVEGKVGLPRDLDLLKSSTSEDSQNVQFS